MAEEEEAVVDEDGTTLSHVTITIRPSAVADLMSLGNAIRLELEPVRQALYPQPERRQIQKWDSFICEMAERVKLWIERLCDGEFHPLYLESRKVRKVLYVSLAITFDEAYCPGLDQPGADEDDTTHPSTATT